MLGQDVGGAVPADLAGGQVPVEGGGAGGLGGKAQTQFVLELTKLGDRVSLWNSRVQHNPPSPPGFSGLVVIMAVGHLRKRKSLHFCEAARHLRCSLSCR